MQYYEQFIVLCVLCIHFHVDKLYKPVFERTSVNPACSISVLKKTKLFVLMYSTKVTSSYPNTEPDIHKTRKHKLNSIVR